MAYSDITLNDRSAVKRWLQRRRFADALQALDGRLDDQQQILDFGAGDGELVRRIVAGYPRYQAWLYEPTPYLMAEARRKLAGLQQVIFAESLASLEAESFDYVFCLEVFEHLPPAETQATIGAIHRLLKTGGRAVIGVPCEIFLPAFGKGVFRMFRRYGEFDAKPRNILAATFGRPPAQRPVAEIATGFAYHFHHLGFDFRALEKQLSAFFNISRKWFSPFPVGGAWFNSEVYFCCEKSY